MDKFKSLSTNNNYLTENKLLLTQDTQSTFNQQKQRIEQFQFIEYHTIKKKQWIENLQQQSDRTIEKKDLKTYMENSNKNTILDKVQSNQITNIIKQEQHIQQQKDISHASQGIRKKKKSIFYCLSRSILQCFKSQNQKQGIEEHLQLNYGQSIDKNINEEEENHIQNSLQAQNGIIDNIFNNSKFDYKLQKYQIYNELLKKKYTLLSHLDSGGQADIFLGYFQNEYLKQQYVFKIYFEATTEEFQKETQIMKSFEKPINIIKIIDSFQIDQFFVLILEKCQYSLKYELQLFKERQIKFKFDNLLQIIFDLLDGLIQFRIYNILHLDIKPSNILISNDGQYCYSDFGNSFYIKENEQINVRYFTKNFSAPEQLKKKEAINFQSDVFSLGKTFKFVISVFKKINEDYLINQNRKREIIIKFEKIIDEEMTQTVNLKRENCKNLHYSFYKQLKVEEYQQFFQSYQKKLQTIIKLYEYDQNKDIQYFQSLKLSYSLINLNLLKIYKNPNFLKPQHNKKIKKQLNNKERSQQALELIDLYKIINQIFSENNPDIATSLYHVGSCYVDLEDNQNGLKYFLESLEMTKQYILSINHHSIALSLNNVGQCYNNLGDYQIGLNYLLESLEMRKQIFSGNHRDIAESLNSVGSCYIDLGDNQNGLKYLLESLEMRKQIFSGNHLDIATSLNNVGLCYNNLGDNQNGLKYLLESLEMTKQIFSGNHPSIATSLNNVGVCYKNLGDNQNGLKYLLESLEMAKQIFSGNHSSIATSLNNVGVCYKNLGDNQNGLKYLLESLNITKQIFSGNHPLIAETLGNVGSCYVDLGYPQNGVKYIQESLEMIKQIFSGNHPDIAKTLNKVGQCYSNLGDKKNCLKYSLESLEMMRQIFSRNHPDIAVTLGNVGSCYVDFGDCQNGLKYLLESLEMTKQIFSGNHPSIATSLNNVGYCYKNLGDNQNGLKYLLESLEMTKQIFSGNHRHIAASLNSVGQCYKKLGDNQNGLNYLLESLEMRKQIFSGNHFLIVQSLNNIGSFYMDLGDNQNGWKYFSESSKITKQIFSGGHVDGLYFNNIQNDHI